MVVVALLFGLVWLYFWCKGHWFAGVVGTAFWFWPVFGAFKAVGLGDSAVYLLAIPLGFFFSMIPATIRITLKHGYLPVLAAAFNEGLMRATEPKPPRTGPDYFEMLTLERIEMEQRRDRMASATPQRPRTAVRLLEHSAAHTRADAD